MITLISGGFKYSRPDANFYFDVSYLENPWRNPSLRELNNEKLMSHMMELQDFSILAIEYANLITILDTFYPNENLRFAFYCSAGEYRSPLMVEAINKKLKEEKGITAKVIHTHERT